MFLCLNLRGHECISKMRADFDRVRLDMRGMLANMETAAEDAEPLRKKPKRKKAVLFECDSDSESQNKGDSATMAGDSSHVQDQLDTCTKSNF